MLENRVNPWGQLCAVADRGSLMGNRGILHGSSNEILRQWAHKSWVTCLLSYKGIKRPKPFSPGNYSELFFLDEATAFAAGHRPCTFCQRERSMSFKKAWLSANVPIEQQSNFRLSSLDAQLHQERVANGGSKNTYEAHVSELPNGTIFQHSGHAYLIADGACRQWSFQGYAVSQSPPSSAMVSVLTPRSVVAAFLQGFQPKVHPAG
ncbi:MAG: hypothetical protein LCH89_17260 [Proteobacteria bacterium]|nr:hypothetical protein [Pseudomonadota bacterium]